MKSYDVTSCDTATAYSTPGPCSCSWSELCFGAVLGFHFCLSSVGLGSCALGSSLPVPGPLGSTPIPLIPYTPSRYPLYLGYRPRLSFSRFSLTCSCIRCALSRLPDAFGPPQNTYPVLGNKNLPCESNTSWM